MNTIISLSKDAAGKAAAEHAATSIRQAIALRGSARIIAATGASQLEFLGELVKQPDIHWASVEMFHLDEYVGLTDAAPASFCKYLRERLIVPTGIKNFHLLHGDGDPAEVIKEVSAHLQTGPIDIAFVGIGENSHLAFNDPPADFERNAAYEVVSLDKDCRMQQLNEGWFATLEDVPTKAISMTAQQILKATEILAIVPDLRKARAVKASLEEGISPSVPSSILRTHPNTTLYLDSASASLLADPQRSSYSA